MFEIFFRCCGRDTLSSPVAGTSVKHKGHSENGIGSVNFSFPSPSNGTRAAPDFPGESLHRAQGPFQGVPGTQGSPESPVQRGLCSVPCFTGHLTEGQMETALKALVCYRRSSLCETAVP